MSFERLTILDVVGLCDGTEDRLSRCSDIPVIAPADDPSNAAEVLERAAGSDGLIVSYKTSVPFGVMDANPGMRYVGLCASPFADPTSCNVDLASAALRGITVTALGQHGDEATAEWVIASMLNAALQIGPVSLRESRCELFGKRLGIVGLGAVGSHVARRAQAFGMDVVYSARARKPFADSCGYSYLQLVELLETSDIVTVHIGKGVQIMGTNEFERLPTNTLLINTSIGSVFDPMAFTAWLSRGGLAIADVTVDPCLGEPMEESKNAWVSPRSAADTLEMKQRKSDQLVENVEAFLAGNPVRVL